MDLGFREFAGVTASMYLWSLPLMSVSSWINQTFRLIGLIENIHSASSVQCINNHLRIAAFGRALNKCIYLLPPYIGNLGTASILFATTPHNGCSGCCTHRGGSWPTDHPCWRCCPTAAVCREFAWWQTWRRSHSLFPLRRRLSTTTEWRSWRCRWRWTLLRTMRWRPAGAVVMVIVESTAFRAESGAAAAAATAASLYDMIRWIQTLRRLQSIYSFMCVWMPVDSFKTSRCMPHERIQRRCIAWNATQYNHSSVCGSCNNSLLSMFLFPLCGTCLFLYGSHPRQPLAYHTHTPHTHT